MNAPLHDSDRRGSDPACYQASGVPDRSGARKMRDLRVGDAHGIGHAIGKAAQPRAQHQPYLWAERGLGADELGRRFSAREFVQWTGLGSDRHWVVELQQGVFQPREAEVCFLSILSCLGVLGVSALVLSLL